MSREFAARKLADIVSADVDRHRKTLALCVLLGALQSTSSPGICEARRRHRARPTKLAGIYVPAFFKRVPLNQLTDDVQNPPQKYAGLYVTNDLTGKAPEQIAIVIDHGQTSAAWSRGSRKNPHPRFLPLAGVKILGTRFSSEGFKAPKGRFVVLPYQVQFSSGAPIRLLCKSGLLLDGYPRLFQKSADPIECPASIAAAVQAGTLKPRRFLVEGRWAVMIADAPIHGRPRANSDVIGECHKGDDVDVIDKLDGWLMIHGGGVEGFVPEGSAK